MNIKEFKVGPTWESLIPILKLSTKTLNTSTAQHPAINKKSANSMFQLV